MIIERGKKIFLNTAVKNAIKFTFNVLFAYVFQMIFGADNILPGVAICVGLTTLPDFDLGIRRLPMAGITVFLYTMAGVIAQFALGNVFAAFLANFIFVAAILLLSGEPVYMKPSVSFMLCFIFCQANPVTPDRIGMRMASLFTGGLLVAAVTALQWRKKGLGAEGRGLSGQILLSSQRRGYILRSALGIAAAMIIGMLAGLKRPMWVSIVVMSLTQVDFEQTKKRIMYRSMATILGAAVFSGVLIQFIPDQYAMIFILLLGYLSFFTTEYKYTQIVNAVCALNASLFVLEPENAVVLRVFCLALGIFVTLGMWKLQFFMKRLINRHIQPMPETTANL